MLTAKKLQEYYGLGAKDSKYRAVGNWYHHLKHFPGILFDRYGFVVFNSKDEYLECPQLRHSQDLHVVPDISAIQGYKLFEDFFLQTVLRDPSTPQRVLSNTERIVRDKDLVGRLKRLYEFSCQICSTRIVLPKAAPYVEVHHIRPLGTPHNGADEPSNMLCVCPNCHTRLDYFSIPIELKSLKNLRHTILNDNVSYHNNLVGKATRNLGASDS